jgi:hypothetical protein
MSTSQIPQDHSRAQVMHQATADLHLRIHEVIREHGLSGIETLNVLASLQQSIAGAVLRRTWYTRDGKERSSARSKR